MNGCGRVRVPPWDSVQRWKYLSYNNVVLVHDPILIAKLSPMWKSSYLIVLIGLFPLGMIALAPVVDCDLYYNTSLYCLHEKDGYEHGQF